MMGDKHWMWQGEAEAGVPESLGGGVLCPALKPQNQKTEAWRQNVSSRSYMLQSGASAFLTGFLPLTRCLPFPPLPVSNQIYHELCGPWAGDLSPDTCEILQIPRGSLSGRKDGCVYLGSRDRQG